MYRCSQRLGFLYIFDLAPFRATYQQENDLTAMLREVHTPPCADVDPQFTDALSNGSSITD